MITDQNALIYVYSMDEKLSLKYYQVKHPLIGYQYRELLFLKDIFIRDQLCLPNLIELLRLSVRSIGDERGSKKRVIL